MFLYTTLAPLNTCSPTPHASCLWDMFLQAYTPFSDIYRYTFSPWWGKWGMGREGVSRRINKAGEDLFISWVPSTFLQALSRDGDDKAWQCSSLLAPFTESSIQPKVVHPKALIPHASAARENISQFHQHDQPGSTLLFDRQNLPPTGSVAIKSRNFFVLGFGSNNIPNTGVRRRK